MDFMIMHKVDERTEAGLRPSQELIAAVGKMVGEAQKSGRMIDGAGLLPSKKRVRLQFKGGRRTITQGPYQGANELIAGFAMLKVKNMEEAIECASKFAAIIGDIEIEVGPVTEPWDLGMMPKPEGEVPLRVLSMHKADSASEAGVPPSPKVIADLGKLMDEMIKAGVFVSGQGLAPSAKGARIKAAEGGKYTVIDGPFTESKELISGYMVLTFDSKGEAVEWAKQYAGIVGAREVDVREVQ